MIGFDLRRREQPYRASQGTTPDLPTHAGLFPAQDERPELGKLIVHFWPV